LGEAEPVPRVVLYDSFDAVELLLRRRDELDTLLIQALVVAVDVVGLEDADAEISPSSVMGMSVRTSKPSLSR
jgi:hypothetical protein